MYVRHDEKIVLLAAYGNDLHTTVRNCGQCVCDRQSERPNCPLQLCLPVCSLELVLMDILGPIRRRQMVTNLICVCDDGSLFEGNESPTTSKTTVVLISSMCTDH